MHYTHFFSKQRRGYFLLLFITATAGISLGFYIEPSIVIQPKPIIKLGAYYFDGWSGLTQGHLTEALVDSFPERESRWGWITSSPSVMKDQIDVAAEAGLSFFNFCWYYPEPSMGKFKGFALNRSLNFFLKAPNQKRLQFCILATNHQGFNIGPANWTDVTRAWLPLLKHPSYVKVNGRPLLTFFSIGSLIKQFGKPQAVHMALDSLRAAVQNEGLPGITLAVCSSPDSSGMALAQACGFDVLTGYNYHGAGVKPKQVETPIDSLIAGSRRIWNRFQKAPLPYIPAVTLNWDARPWATPTNDYAVGPRYIGYSPESVYRSVRAVQDWLTQNPDKTPKEHIALLYAWNEYGEGAWLTPSKNGKNSPLIGLKRAMKQ